MSGFSETLRRIRFERHMTQEQLAEQIGVAKSTLTGYEKGNSEPDMQKIEKIMSVLGVDANFLWQDEMQSSAGLSYSIREIDLISKYRSLDAYGKDLVDTVLDKEAQRCADEFSQLASRRIITLRRYTSPAAAGAPLYAESDYEDVDFPAEIVPDGTSYALGICGKSMEPEIPDGCTVFVEKTEAVCDGDIIVAWIEGDGSVCKRVVMDGDQVVRLESANRDFADITGADLNGMRVYGKVLGYTTD